MSNSAKKYKRMAVAALAAALIFLVVAFLQIPFPIGQGGYINIGDAFIFLFATLLPLPYAVAAAVSEQSGVRAQPAPEKVSADPLSIHYRMRFFPVYKTVPRTMPRKPRLG